MDETSNHDRCQCHRIRQLIANFERGVDILLNFERGSDRLHYLIADLEVLIAGLEGAPPDRKEAFHQAWDKLRKIHAPAVESTLASMKAILKSVPRLPCPCCGFLVFNQLPGSFDICPICFWEDDPVQLRFPDFAGGANKPSLMEAQWSFAEFGACEVRCTQFVRSPTQEDVRDPDWRPVDPRRDLSPALDRGDGTDDWPPSRESTRLYYWRPDFFRSGLRGRDN